MPAAMPRKGVSTSATATGFQAKPVKIPARSHSAIAQAPASTSASANGWSRPARQARPAASIG